MALVCSCRTPNGQASATLKTKPGGHHQDTRHSTAVPPHLSWTQHTHRLLTSLKYRSCAPVWTSQHSACPLLTLNDVRQQCSPWIPMPKKAAENSRFFLQHLHNSHLRTHTKAKHSRFQAKTYTTCTRPRSVVQQIRSPAGISKIWCGSQCATQLATHTHQTLPHGKTLYSAGARLTSSTTNCSSHAMQKHSLWPAHQASTVHADTQNTGPTIHTKKQDHYQHTVVCPLCMYTTLPCSFADPRASHPRASHTKF